MSPCQRAGVGMGTDHYADYELPVSLTTATLHFDHCTRSADTAMNVNATVCDVHFIMRHCAVCAVDGEAAKRKHISNSLWWPHHHGCTHPPLFIRAIIGPTHPTICNMGGGIARTFMYRTNCGTNAHWGVYVNTPLNTFFYCRTSRHLRWVIFLNCSLVFHLWSTCLFLINTMEVSKHQFWI